VVVGYYSWRRQMSHGEAWTTYNATLPVWDWIPVEVPVAHVWVYQ
jgi:hypothetical protein